MKLSICIPTYNRSSLLKETLNNLIPQVIEMGADNYIEIIVSNNASNDETDQVMSEISNRYSFVKYFQNEVNIGLDGNTLRVIREARGDYIWLCSDDDIPLPGAVEKIFEVIEKENPKFVYLNHAGFFDIEPYQIVLQRNSDRDDIVYQSGEKMFCDFRINHFSSTIFKRDLLLNYIYVAKEYENEEYGRGFAFTVIANHIILSEKGPFYYIGKICLAVRNILKPDYSVDVLTFVIIDHARFYQDLRKRNLISRESEIKAINWFIKGFYKILLPMKCLKDPRYTFAHVKKIVYFYRGYPLFYLYMMPILTLPRFLLFFPYLLGRLVKKIFNVVSF